jgi:hypothetical protein
MRPASLELTVKRMIRSALSWRRLGQLLQAAADLHAWRRHSYCMLRFAHKDGYSSRPDIAFL